MLKYLLLVAALSCVCAPIEVPGVVKLKEDHVEEAETWPEGAIAKFAGAFAPGDKRVDEWSSRIQKLEKVVSDIKRALFCRARLAMSVGDVGRNLTFENVKVEFSTCKSYKTLPSLFRTWQNPFFREKMERSIRRKFLADEDLVEEVNKSASATPGSLTKLASTQTIGQYVSLVEEYLSLSKKKVKKFLVCGIERGTMAQALERHKFLVYGIKRKAVPKASEYHEPLADVILSFLSDELVEVSTVFPEANSLRNYIFKEYISRGVDEGTTAPLELVEGAKMVLNRCLLRRIASLVKSMKYNLPDYKIRLVQSSPARSSSLALCVDVYIYKLPEGVTPEDLRSTYELYDITV